MNCKQHYWSNSINSVWNNWHLASEPNEQRCTHSNCKTFNSADATVPPYHCNKCFAKQDIQNYDTWPGSVTYHRNDLRGIYTEHPYKLESTYSQKCEPLCDVNYWTNVRSKHTPTQETILFKCSPDQCKLWEPEDETAVNECKQCWDKDDVNDYSNWDARGSFTPQELVGRNTDEPFKLDATTKTCALQCKVGYWTNHVSTFNQMSNGSDQRCTYANCKNWDYDGSSKQTPNLCNDVVITQQMITLADTLAQQLCPLVTDHSNNVVAEVYPKFAPSLRFGIYENGTNSNDKTHYATIHYIGKGVFKYMNRAFDEFFIMIATEDKTVLRFCEDYTNFGEDAANIKSIKVTYDNADQVTNIE